MNNLQEKCLSKHSRRVTHIPWTDKNIYIWQHSKSNEHSHIYLWIYKCLNSICINAYTQLTKLEDTKTHTQITWKMFKQTIYDSDPQSMNRYKHIYIWYPHQYFLQSYTIISFIRPIDQAYRSIIMHKSSSTEC